MKPESISERMMYNTVRLETGDGTSCGTGSFFNFRIGEKIVPVIITNKHVIKHNCNETTKFFLHLKNDNGEPDGNLGITYDTNWSFHEDKDICYCYAAPVFRHVKERWEKDVYYLANDETLIKSNEQLSELNALEELVMVGYPIGLSDIRNNFPIFRKGYTASHPAIDFNEDGIGLVDMACFPGSSGSPIYILNENGYKDKKGTTFLGKSRIILLGFLFSGPILNATGELIVRDIPTTQETIAKTEVMINLGYYIKSSEILAFKKQIEIDLSKNA